ncbi:hypothetical protein BaRGS_00024673 [Batillaria attramentaria]|uniref:Uncharacterized protein n=1 Tax=Batillaria attramentaria TaxID=370345 RepID=A0ABD0KAD2_9CAEN
MRTLTDQGTLRLKKKEEALIDSVGLVCVAVWIDTRMYPQYSKDGSQQHALTTAQGLCRCTCKLSAISVR